MNKRWLPFLVGDKTESIRPLQGIGGVEDRLRVVAFAELQARDLFRWGADRFPEISQEWKDCWRRFADVENRHAQLLLSRMEQLGFLPGARQVSDKLAKLCLAAQDAELFLFLLASAEERGMESGLILGQQMQSVDAESAAIFLTIAEEEKEHVNFSRAVFVNSDFNEMRIRSKALNLTLQKSDGPLL